MSLFKKEKDVNERLYRNLEKFREIVAKDQQMIMDIEEKKEVSYKHLASNQEAIKRHMEILRNI